MDTPNEFQPLIDEIYRDKVRWARQESPEKKFVAGLDLFEDALVWMRAGIRGQFPHFTGEQIEAEVIRRIARIRQIEEHGLYQAVPRS
jgi:hypothetical protein